MPADIPPRLRTLLRDCLIRDPRQRLRDIGDARLVLDKIISGAPDDAGAVTPATDAAVPPRSSVLPWAVAGAVAILSIALAIPAMRHLAEAPPPETRLDIVTPPTTQPAVFELSPDGTQIVFVASDAKTSRLWLRSLSTTEAQPLAGTEGATRPFWSPDSRSVGFFADGSLKRLNLGGGAPQTLAPAPNGYGGTWNAEDVIVFAPSTTTTLMRVPAGGGTAVALTTLGPEQYGHFEPRFLADGRRFVFIVGGSADVDGIYLGALDGNTPTRLVPQVNAVTSAPGDWLLWLRAGSLVAQRLDAEQRVLTGNVVTIADRMPYTAPRPASVSATGVVAYRTKEGLERQLTWVDRSGVVRGIVGEPDDSWLSPRVAPDGRRIAVIRWVQDNADIWLLDGARSSRFTFFRGQDRQPVWSPDGSRIVYQALGQGMGELWFKLASGAGEEERLFATDLLMTPTSLSPDGRFLLYISIDPTSNADLWALPLGRGAEHGAPFVFLKTAFREAYGSFSPDGRWVAYHSNESGRAEVYVRPFVPPGEAGTAAPAAAGQVQISTAGGIHPVWRADGKELYYLDPDGDLMAAPVIVAGGAVEPGVPVKLFSTRIYGGGVDIQQGRQYDVTRDGRFLINAMVNDTIAPITLLQHWNPDAKKK
jgi:Tol biopolymer transport system component